MAAASDRLATRILLGLVLGAALGLLATWLAPAAQLGRVKWFATEVCDPLGRVFLGLLFFVVVPLVFASLAQGVVQLGRLDRLGPLAGRTFLLFGLNMAIGVALGLALMNLVQPGARLDPEARGRLLAEFGQSAAEMQGRAESLPGLSFAVLVDMFFPRNLLKAVTEFQMLPLIAFALVVGMAGTQLAGAPQQRLRDALEVVAQVMTRIVHYALRLAPYAVGAMIFSVAVKAGVGFLVQLLLFVAVVLGGIALHLFGTMSLLVRVLGRRPPAAFFGAVKTILVTAFSTSSSNATLPTSLQVTREKLGVSAPVAGFVLPLGATMNMSGTALYEGCVVLFVAQVYGVPLGLGQQLTLVVLAVLSAVAVSGIPGGSLPLIVGLLVNFGLPAEGIALILGVDRILDMARTALNVGADVVTAVIVDRQLAKPSADG
jgi:DAACS family dicarboxylate/amino acid:cation (Na+ or H+) symporter